MICVDAESVFHRARFLAPFVYQRGRSRSTRNPKQCRQANVCTVGGRGARSWRLANEKQTKKKKKKNYPMNSRWKPPAPDLPLAAWRRCADAAQRWDGSPGLQSRPSPCLTWTRPAECRIFRPQSNPFYPSIHFPNPFYMDGIYYRDDWSRLLLLTSAFPLTPFLGG